MVTASSGFASWASQAGHTRTPFDELVSPRETEHGSQKMWLSNQLDVGFGRRRATYLQVVTTALSLRRARHLSELQRKGKSIIFAKTKGTQMCKWLAVLSFSRLANKRGFDLLQPYEEVAIS